jgi:hypothetical protein
MLIYQTPNAMSNYTSTITVKTRKEVNDEWLPSQTNTIMCHDVVSAEMAIQSEIYPLLMRDERFWNRYSSPGSFMIYESDLMNSTRITVTYDKEHWDVINAMVDAHTVRLDARRKYLLLAEQERIQAELATMSTS